MDDRPDDVVVEELEALDGVARKLADLPPAKTASEAPIVRELERIRERLLSGDENKDLSALTEQYHNQSAILSVQPAPGPRCMRTPLATPSDEVTR